MYEQEMLILQGTVSAVIFQNYDNGYTVLRLQCDDGQTTESNLKRSFWSGLCPRPGLISCPT